MSPPPPVEAVFLRGKWRILKYLTLGYSYLFLLGYRPRLQGEEAYRALISKPDGRLLLLFHEDLSLLCQHGFSWEKKVLVSKNYLVLQTASRGAVLLGFTTRMRSGGAVRGVFKGKRGIAAVAPLRRIIATIRSGGTVIFAVDGGRGPRHCVAATAARLVQKFPDKVVLARFAPKREHSILRTWDKHKLPLPFSEVRCCYADLHPKTANDTASIQAAIKEGLFSMHPPTRFARIVTIRHGRPDLDRRMRVDWRGYNDWWSAYDEASLCAKQKVPGKVMGKIGLIDDGSSNLYLCSTLPRAVESARLAIGTQAALCKDALFVEAPLPAPPVPFLRMQAAKWGALARFFWILGYAGKREGQSACRKRVLCACDKLESHASRQPVVLFAHGYINWMIGLVLRRRGWKRVYSRGGQKYWSMRIYERKVTK